MSNSTIFFSVGLDAIDAALITKDRAVANFALSRGIPIEKIAAIGDSANDLPFLAINGLACRGAPLNAQAKVKEVLKQYANAFIASKNCFEGFEQFYERCMACQVKYIFSDRDGVILCNREDTPMDRFHRIISDIGIGTKPVLKILTGSSYEQNLQFIEAYSIREAVYSNKRVREDPYLILAENGAVEIDVISGNFKLSKDIFDVSLLSWLMNRFKLTLFERIESEVFHRFGLSWSNDSDDIIGKVQAPQKRTMVTIDIPQLTIDGQDFRGSGHGSRFGMAVLDIMKEVANSSKVPFCVL